MQGQFSHLCRCCWVSKTHTEESLVAVTRFLVSVYSNHGSCSFQGQRSHCLQTDRNYTRHGVAQSQNIHNNCDFRGCILNVSGPPHISRRRSKDPHTKPVMYASLTLRGLNCLPSRECLSHVTVKIVKLIPPLRTCRAIKIVELLSSVL